MVFQSETIGRSVSRVDGPDKVTGETLYTADVILPGMLTGKILRSPHTHVRIKSISTTAAWRNSVSWPLSQVDSSAFRCSSWRWLVGLEEP